MTVTLAVACAPSVLAHGGSTDIVGTVTSLRAEQVMVKDREEKSISIRVTKETKYRKGDAPAAATELKVGDRVVVEAAGKADAFTAVEIRFSSSAPQSGHEGEHHHANHD